ncbi:hypothetical protein GCM10025768_02630 [Microbacterium pseudoresistens]|uniref:Uncharacterized protein n=1 Tax=Microbacterium pseudoresistens TaxID=640634 RepID=A0A7Y9JNW2_9MICO|nr:hypothetical protein [Microbacterium pseudoresistens]NYD54099.1 hypothetical protein [Microbacterium pseudoresistens]
MHWTSDPEQAGGWLRERLRDDLGGDMHSVVPRGFEAYARVFHPPAVRSLPDRPVPTMDEWMRLPGAEQQRLMDLFDDRATTWAATAEAFGTTMHPLAQWARIVRTPPGEDWNTRIAPDGREFTSPAEGQLEPSLLAAVTAHLVAHTSSPDGGFAAVWEGWGGLVGALGEGNGRTFLEFTDEPAHEKVLRESLLDRFNNPFRKPTWHPGILDDDVSRGARLSLPAREHVLFAAAPAVFADPDWILAAPWRDREAEAHGFPPSAQHPSLIWPADQAWVLVSEIDFDSTIIAGSAALVRALCADQRIEALPIREGSDLHWDADEINR